MSGGRRILFVTWDGPQVRYLQGLFLPIFKALEDRGHLFSILQFSWGDDNGAAQACALAGIDYRRVDVNRRLGGLGALATAAVGGRHVDRAVRDWNIDLLMPRSIWPAFSVMRSESAGNVPILFDADGLAADERVEFGGLHGHGPTYRIMRAIEARMVARADHVLVRTASAAAILATRSGCERQHFSAVTNGRAAPPMSDASHSRGVDQAAPRLAYVGSLGPQYRPLSMLALVKAMRERLGGLTLTIFTADDAAARSLLSENGLEKARWISCESLTPEALAERLPEYDGGLALRAESLSMSAVAPVKIGDYLMAGLPIIGTAGIGDVAELIAADVMLPVNGEGDAGRAVDWLTNRVGSQMKIVRRKCRELGERLFSLERSVALYDEAIARVKRPGARTADARAIA